VGVTGLRTGPVRRRVVRTALLPGWLAVAVAVTLGVSLDVWTALPVEYRYLPLVASVLVLGLPHGALDHLTLSRHRGERPTRRGLVAFGVGYLLLGGAYVVVWFLAPAAAFASFILLTWLHWGQGDLWPLVAASDGAYPASRPLRALTAAVRGGLPMVVPLVGFPERYRAVAATVVGLFDPDAVSALDAAFAAGVHQAVGVGFGALTVLALAGGLVAVGPTRAWAVDVAETGLLWLFFLTVPPVLAIGLYFALWHSVRHLVRLATVWDADGTEGERFRRSVSRLARDAVPLTLGAVAILAALVAVVPNRPGTVPEFAGVYLVLLAALTLPHVVVVSLLDRRQGVWSASTPAGGDRRRL
jgi:Brp/Blh family beta-carotene 15,15'-monooxygenase